MGASWTRPPSEKNFRYFSEQIPSTTPVTHSPNLANTQHRYQLVLVPQWVPIEGPPSQRRRLNPPSDTVYIESTAQHHQQATPSPLQPVFGPHHNVPTATHMDLHAAPACTQQPSGHSPSVSQHHVQRLAEPVLPRTNAADVLTETAGQPDTHNQYITGPQFSHTERPTTDPQIQ